MRGRSQDISSRNFRWRARRIYVGAYSPVRDYWQGQIVSHDRSLWLLVFDRPERGVEPEEGNTWKRFNKEIPCAALVHILLGERLSDEALLELSRQRGRSS
ncbi:MAG: hypothetical protein OXH16_21455 [Gemmatimonadetes bacterium]|nr:hypothetical protein [Gemmatimonadota bacterium]